ncbi:4'-phosphopantetheinyl transferase family protein [Inhella proteolytica]|uniref:4'-phosphopantetheinyl transferase n=1 Tax=Inhella proteolytica TaxID=2795029 RepID=A0A931J4L9_9BURK|nr:hypothetical protein [Inhella proteolytica]MBH9577454.1 hypothetical protein [Inhella proteolytica]
MNPQICVAPLAALQADLPECPEAWLARSEAARLQAFSLPARRQRYLAGRWLLRRLLGAASGQALPQLEQDAEGRSLCPTLPPWRLSLSHSGDWFAAAVAEEALGIDIEQPRPGRDLAALASGLGLPDAQAPAFYRHWTLGEAWLKQGPGPGLLAAQRQLRWVPDPQGAGRCWHQPAHDLHLALWAPPQAVPRFWPYPGTAPLAWADQGRWGPASDDPALNRSFSP